MDIINKLKQPEIPSYALRRAISYIAKELDVRQKDLGPFTFTNRGDGHSSGRCWLCSGKIHMSVGYYLMKTGQIPEGAPSWKSDCWWHGDEIRRVGGDRGVRHRFYLMISTLAHEIAHRSLHLQGVAKDRNGLAGGNEKTVQWHAQQVMNKINWDRTAWLDEMLAEPKRVHVAARAAKDPAKVRAQKDLALLKTWERKQALAKTKVAKYKRKVRRAIDKGLI